MSHNSSRFPSGSYRHLSSKGSLTNRPREDLKLSWDFRNALNYQRKVAESMKEKSPLDKAFDSFKESAEAIEYKKRLMAQAQLQFRSNQQQLLIERYNTIHFQ